MREVDTIGATRRLNAHRVFSLVVGFCALIGWSGFAYSTGASANVQRELRAELASSRAVRSSFWPSGISNGLPWVT